MRQSSIKTKVVGFAVVELHDVTINISAKDRTAFESNPEQVIARLLRREGHQVNGVRVVTKKKGKRARSHWYHIIYPKVEQSGWICA